MKAFGFSLQKVLDWRRTQMDMEELKVRQHAAAVAELDRARAQLEAAGVSAEIEIREWRPVAGSDLAALAGFRRYVRQQEQRIAAKRAECEQQLAGQRQRLMEARRRYRLLERLRERRVAEWQKAADQELEDFAAEAYLAQWGRRGDPADRV